LVYTLWRSAAV